MVQVLRGRYRLSGAFERGRAQVGGRAVSASVSNMWKHTHNPILAPTDSANPQACCRDFSSWDVDSFPRCFSESLTTSYGVKYGL